MSQSSQSACPFEHSEDPSLETEQIKKTADLTVDLINTRYPPPKAMLRGVHPKSHGCVRV